MPLSKLQLALVRLLQQAPTTTTTTAAALAPSEQRWLASLADTPGFRVTRDIRQWWRTIRLQTAAPLTLRLLQRSDKAAWIEHYLATARCESLFFATEALAFLNFVMAQNTDDANLGAVAAFERALVRVHAQRERAVSVITGAKYAASRDVPRAAPPGINCARRYSSMALGFTARSGTASPVH